MDNLIEEKTFIDTASLTSNLDYFPIMLCLHCKTRIPQIRLIRDGINVKIEMKCYYCKHEALMKLKDCLEEMKKIKTKKVCQSKIDHSKNQAHKYCLVEKQWLCNYCVLNHQNMKSNHLMSQAKIDFEVECQLHKKKNKLICKQCHLEICKQCKESDLHKDHIVIDMEENKKELEKHVEFEKHVLNFKQNFESNKQIKDSLIRLLTAKISEFTQLRRDLENVYYSFEKSNEMILEFIFTIKSNYETLQTIPIPELIPNIINNSTINNEKLMIDIEKIEQSCLTAIKFFKSNHFIQLPATNKVITKQDAHSESITCMIQLQEDDKIATGGCDNKIKIWSITNEINDDPKDLKGHQSKVLALIQLKNTNLVSGAYDSEVIIWNIKLLKQLKKFKGHEKSIYCLLENSKINKLISASEDETIRIWDYDTSKVQCLNTINEDTTTLIQLNDKSIVTTCLKDNSIKLWDPTSFTLFKTLESHKQEINVVCQLRNSKLASGSYDEIIIWDLVTYTQIEKIVSENENFVFVYSMTQLCDGTLVLGCNNKLISFNLNEMQIVDTYENHNNLITSIVEIKDKRIVSCSWDKTMRIWNI